MEFYLCIHLSFQLDYNHPYCIALDELLNISNPPFPQSGDNNRTNFVGWF